MLSNDWRHRRRRKINAVLGMVSWRGGVSIYLKQISVGIDIDGESGMA